MAQVTRRVWIGRGPTGRKIKRTAYGFTVMENGKRVRRYDAAWSREDAERALAAYQLGLAPAPALVHDSMTFSEAIERYIAAKASKRSIGDDRLHLARLKQAFGADTPLSSISAALISQYKSARLRSTIKRGGDRRPIAPATLNRELACLRSLLKLAVEEWEVLSKVPRIKLEREPQGRLRWLTEEEQVRLLEACRASMNRDLHDITVIALETGMRRGEILGLTWDRVDMARNVLRLEVTKSGRRREIPMRDVVYKVLAARAPKERVGRVWPDRGIRKAFESAVAVAQLDDFHFHDLRHTFASWFMMRGGTLQALRELLGHATMAMTLRYSHLSHAHLRGEIERTAASVVQAVAAPSASARDRIGAGSPQSTAMKMIV